MNGNYRTPESFRNKLWKYLPFWSLIAGSVLASLLLFERIYLSHAIHRKHQILAANQQEAANGPAYENAWKQFASGIYQVSRQDPALASTIQRHDITIQVNQPAAFAQAPSKPQDTAPESRIPKQK